MNFWSQSPQIGLVYFYCAWKRIKRRWRRRQRKRRRKRSRRSKRRRRKRKGGEAFQAVVWYSSFIANFPHIVLDASVRRRCIWGKGICSDE